MHKIKDYRIIYIIMCLLIPTAASYLNPIISLYLSEVLHFTSQKIALTFIVTPVILVLVVFLCGKISDKGFSRRRIILISAIFGVITNLIFMSEPSELTLFLALVPCYALSQVAFSQIFASAREYSVQYMTSSLGFTTFLRSLASVAWVAGPPISYFLITNVSYDALFILCASVYSTAGITAITMLPEMKDIAKANSRSVEGIKIFNQNIITLFVSTVLMYTAFSSYLNTMPLYLIYELNLDKDVPGYMFSLSAFLEIPIMMLCIRFAKKAGLKKVIASGVICQLVYLTVLPHISTTVQILISSILPAMFIGTVSTMGMVLFQELLPKLPGQATSLFLNGCTSGIIIGGAVIGLSETGHYKVIYYLGSILTLIALALLYKVRKPEEIR